MASEKFGPDRFDDLNVVSSDDNADEVTWTEAEEKVVRNKLDWQIVPPVTLLYLLCFLDRYVVKHTFMLSEVSTDMSLQSQYR